MAAAVVAAEMEQGAMSARYENLTHSEAIDAVDDCRTRIADLEQQLTNRDIRLDTANHLAEHLYADIAELERREALLTAFVGVWDHYYKRLFGNDWENEADAWHSLDRARLALDWLPVPDIEAEVASFRDTGSGTPQDGGEG